MQDVGVDKVGALVFDVFGTVVDWRSSIIREGDAWNQAKGIALDWAEFADEWRRGYQPAMQQVRDGDLPWTKLDDLHRMILTDLLACYGATSVTPQEIEALNRVWHRLMPWPDAVDGLTRLKQHFVIASLSNGNVSLLVNMAKYSGLPWDCVLSAELFHHYKPHPSVYLGAADLLGYAPDQVLMVAAHPTDLDAAIHAGLRTAYIPRPLEFGPDQAQETIDTARFDLVAQDFGDLADQLSRG